MIISRKGLNRPIRKELVNQLFPFPPNLNGVPMANKLDELQQKIDALQKERDTLLESQKADAIEQINAMIKTFGLHRKDLTFMNGYGTRSQGRTGKPPVKYRSGSFHWSGRGRKPKWVADHLAKGGKLDEFLVK
jgi:DNA-binding protein H-NS